MESNRFDTNNVRSNDEVGRLRQPHIPNYWNTGGYTNSCMTLLLEEPHCTCHLKIEQEINTRRQGDERGESYLLSYRFELINGDLKHKIYHPEQHELELETEEGEDIGGEEKQDLDYRVLVDGKQQIKGIGIF
ncbi:hypothetical protein HAX54_035651 [Datura stramonium]|uniref:Uncharacterized protein n=1 Tax=Datura stramonium TaxID=4076 RepID=A0ABS8SFH2_DATST|nr:hypothetical protein [Datura stramonium]